MADSPNTDTTLRLIPFTIDGQPYETSDLSQTAADLLRLAGLDPSGYDLAEVTKEGPAKDPFKDDDIVTIYKDERFVTIRQEASVT